jgi:hypothetical protein
MTKCKTCRFRLMIDGRTFQCAARHDHKGWAYVWEQTTWRNPGRDCNLYVQGEGLHVGHELRWHEFCKIAGERIRPQDWEKWQKDGIKDG